MQKGTGRVAIQWLAPYASNRVFMSIVFTFPTENASHAVLKGACMHEKGFNVATQYNGTLCFIDVVSSPEESNGFSS